MEPCTSMIGANEDMDSVSTKHIFEPLMELRPWRALCTEGLKLEGLRVRGLRLLGCVFFFAGSTRVRA